VEPYRRVFPQNEADLDRSAVAMANGGEGGLVDPEQMTESGLEVAERDCAASQAALANCTSPLLTSGAGPRTSIGNLEAGGPGAAPIYRVLDLSLGLPILCGLLTEPGGGLASFNHAARAGGSGLYELPDLTGADISFAER
jgi:hypothetical protein